MPTTFIVNKNKIYASVNFGNSMFHNLISVFKEHKLKYREDIKAWEIPHSKIDDIIEEIEDIDIINMSEAVEDEIERLKRPPILIQETGVTFEENELKASFKKGKKPFEDFQEKDIKKAISHTAFALNWDMGCVAEGTIITVNIYGASKRMPIEKYYAWTKSSRKKDPLYLGKVRCLINGTHFGLNTPIDVLFSGEKECIEVLLESGKKIELTPDHEILTEHGYIPAHSLTKGSVIVTNGKSVCPVCGATENLLTAKGSKHLGWCRPCMYKVRNRRLKEGIHEVIGKDGYVYLRGEGVFNHPNKRTDGLPKHRYVMSQHIGRPLLPSEVVHHKDGNKLNNNIENLEILSTSQHGKTHDHSPNFHKNYLSRGNEIIVIPKYDKVVSVTPVGTKKTYDIKMMGPHHNFVANGIVVHNCGKSFASSSIMHILRKRRHAQKVLILTSASGVINLSKELVKFSSYSENDISVGDKFNRRPFDDVSKKVIICNYRSFLLISDEYQKSINAGVKRYKKTPIPIEKWLDEEEGIVLLDESHHIADPSSRISHVLHLIAPYFKFRYTMTGTPADKEEKYYSQLKFLDKGLVRNLSYSDWCSYYFNVGTKYNPYQVLGPKDDKIRELIYYVKKYSITRFSEDVLDLPDNIIHEVFVKFSPKLEKIYQLYIIEKLKNIQSKREGTIPMNDVSNFFQKMIISIDNPLMLKPEAMAPEIQKEVKGFNFLKDHPKLEALEDIIDKHHGEKVIVWTSHPSVAEILHEKYKDSSLVINGETEVPKGMSRDQLKTSVVDEFKSSKTKNILFAGIQVLNTSITIVEATVNVYFDTHFNYTEFSQSIKRIHRIGQTKRCNTYILIIDESLDVVRRNMMKDKDFIMKNFGNESYLNSKSAQDLFTMKGEVTTDE